MTPALLPAAILALAAALSGAVLWRAFAGVLRRDARRNEGAEGRGWRA